MKYLVCNLKNKLNYTDVIRYNRFLNTVSLTKTELVVLPSFPFISLFDKTGYSIGSQDITSFMDKTITGEVSGDQLKSLDCKYVIVGHGERRLYKKEINIDFINKINNAQESGIKVIYTIGENEKEHDTGHTLDVIERQISEVLNNVEIKDIILAYEPIYNIGSKSKLDIEELSDIINYIKDIIKDKYDTFLPLLYGGSVTTDNILDLIKMNIDGFLIGNEATDTKNVKKLLEIMEK